MSKNIKDARILIIDDERVMIEFARLSLERRGIKSILWSYSGTEAIEILKNISVDVIISDLYLGDLTGLDVKRATPEADFIFVSASNYSDVKDEIKENDFFTKPVNYDGLLARIEEILASK